MLASSSVALQRAAGLALANICVTEEARPSVVQQGGLDELVGLVSHADSMIQFNALRAVADLAAAESTRERVYVCGVVPKLIGLLTSLTRTSLGCGALVCACWLTRVLRVLCA